MAQAVDVLPLGLRYGASHRVIRNEQVYDAALERLSDLMSAAPGTPEFDEQHLGRWVSG
ncbi:hypothetical protein NKJ26_31665 [Mesorhizobium sp. M0152]|uniref:hypothetical protein n=1 Tax=Mesorhizobium sp. M0152 TaxID=2956898 RepID=UPI0033398B01